MFAKTPNPPYYAVIFTSTRTDGDHGYSAEAERMFNLASTQPRFLGAESVRGEDGLGITVSYWDSEQSIANWKRHAEHLPVQANGRKNWYEHYEVRVAKVERAYSFSRAV